ncbi:MAG: diaminopimelate epimerase [Pseudomonadota bacterium]
MDHIRAEALPGLEGRPFWLMDGIGNNFVIVDLRGGGQMTPKAAAMLGDHDGPFGCDQIITLEPGKDEAAPYMGIWNADGSPAGACGNATRCVGWLLMQETGLASAHLSSPAGPLLAKDAGPYRVSVDMGAPRLDWQDIPLSEQMDDTRYIDIKLGPIDAPVLWGPSAVNMGNPHCVFFVEDAEKAQIEKFGPLVENHPLFPEQANVSVVHAIDQETLRLRTWERGVGMTAACGTAACAALVSAHRRRVTGRRATIKLDGGELVIEWRHSDDHVLMTGPISLNGMGRFEEAR